MKTSPLCLSLCLLLVGGCGGPKQAQMRVVQVEKRVNPGPAQSPEELAGEVPPLRGLADARPLVPPEFVPPEPPADPAPDFQ